MLDIHALLNPHEERWLSVEDPPENKYSEVMYLEISTSTCHVIKRKTRKPYVSFMVDSPKW